MGIPACNYKKVESIINNMELLRKVPYKKQNINKEMSFRRESTF
jgi:hypothetical protein